MAEVKITCYVPEGLGLGQQAERPVAGLPEWPRAAGKVAPPAGTGLVPSRLFLFSGMARGNVTWVSTPRRPPFRLGGQYFWVHVPALDISGSSVKGTNVYRHG